MKEITKDELLNAFTADDYEELLQDNRILNLDLKNKTVKLIRYDVGLKGEPGKFQYGKEDDLFIFEYKIVPSFVLLNSNSDFGYDYAVISCRNKTWILEIEGSGEGTLSFMHEKILFKEFVKKIQSKKNIVGIRISTIDTFQKFERTHKNIEYRETNIENTHIIVAESESYDETESIALINEKSLTFSLTI